MELIIEGNTINNVLWLDSAIKTELKDGLERTSFEGDIYIYGDDYELLKAQETNNYRLTGTINGLDCFVSLRQTWRDAERVFKGTILIKDKYYLFDRYNEKKVNIVGLTANVPCSVDVKSKYETVTRDNSTALVTDFYNSYLYYSDQITHCEVMATIVRPDNMLLVTSSNSFVNSFTNPNTVFFKTENFLLEKLTVLRKYAHQIELDLSSTTQFDDLPNGFVLYGGVFRVNIANFGNEIRYTYGNNKPDNSELWTQVSNSNNIYKWKKYNFDLGYYDKTNNYVISNILNWFGIYQSLGDTQVFEVYAILNERKKIKYQNLEFGELYKINKENGNFTNCGSANNNVGTYFICENNNEPTSWRVNLIQNDSPLEASELTVYDNVFEYTREISYAQNFWSLLQEIITNHIDSTITVFDFSILTENILITSVFDINNANPERYNQILNELQSSTILPEEIYDLQQELASYRPAAKQEITFKTITEWLKSRYIGWKVEGDTFSLFWEKDRITNNIQLNTSESNFDNLKEYSYSTDNAYTKIIRTENAENLDFVGLDIVCESIPEKNENSISIPIATDILNIINKNEKTENSFVLLQVDESNNVVAATGEISGDSIANANLSIAYFDKNYICNMPDTVANVNGVDTTVPAKPNKKLPTLKYPATILNFNDRIRTKLGDAILTSYKKKNSNSFAELEMLLLNDNVAIATAPVIAEWLPEDGDQFYNRDSNRFYFRFMVESNGGAEITETGLVASETIDPIITDKKYLYSETEEIGLNVILGRNTSFTPNLEEGKTYYIRPYVKNSAGTTYGETRILLVGYTDVNVNTCKTVYTTEQIGTQLWTKFNYADSKNSTVTMYNPNNDIANVLDYGGLYDYNIALSLVPSGWHLPSKNEYDNLISNITNGGDLKDIVNYWTTDNSNNSKYFYARGAGWYNQLTDTYLDFKEYVAYRSTTDSDSGDKYWTYILDNNSTYTANHLDSTTIERGLSLRLIKDA